MSALPDAEVARKRIRSQRLSPPARATPDRLVAWFGAIQSQDYALATWSVAQRLATRNADVGRAIADGSVVRTHVLRPTWHFVTREDLRWLQQLTSSRVLSMLRHADHANGIDAARITRATRAIASAIERRGHLRRSDIAAELSRAGIATTAWQAGQLLMHAELRTIVCSGIPLGRHQTYALVDERVPQASAMTRDEALATLARRYLQSHGPATVRDFRWWSGLSAVDAVRAIDMLGPAVDRIRAGERTFLSIATRARAEAMDVAHVIQPYDEFVVAYSESRDVVDVSGAARRRTPGAGAALLTRGVLYDGQLIARWQFAPRKKNPAVIIQPLRRFSRRERHAIEAAVSSFEAFCGSRQTSRVDI